MFRKSGLGVSRAEGGEKIFKCVLGSKEKLCHDGCTRTPSCSLGLVIPMSSPLEAGEKFAVSPTSGICKKGRDTVSPMRV